MRALTSLHRRWTQSNAKCCLLAGVPLLLFHWYEVMVTGRVRRTITPRSWHSLSLNNPESHIWYSVANGMRPMLSILHLLTDTCSCHFVAHSTIMSRAHCNLLASMTSTVWRYAFTSSAKSLTVTPWRSSNCANSSIEERKKEIYLPRTITI